MFVPDSLVAKAT